MTAGRYSSQSEFKRSVQEISGISLDDSQLASFAAYADALLVWNQRFNLTSITDPKEVATKHIVDSLTCLQVLGAEPEGMLVDVGTGAGFPGLPLKIVAPNLQVLLVDSVGKKLEFCQHIVDQLGLEHVEVLQARAEEVGRGSQHRQRYHWAVARSVARLPTLIEYLLPLVKVGGSAIAQKGVTAEEEAGDAEHAIQLLGGVLQEIREVQVPGVEEARYLVVVCKVQDTPEEYPRREGMPGKRPLGV